MKTTCDSCHGIRLPHTQQFMAGGHARAAVLQLWSNRGSARVCNRCHYPGHRDCTKCHESPFLQHAVTWRTGHQGASWSRSSQTCLCHEWTPAEHGGRLFCQICHETKPRSARP
jgi:hypothetical protein